jgi:hypothetical protein
LRRPVKHAAGAKRKRQGEGKQAKKYTVRRHIGISRQVNEWTYHSVLRSPSNMTFL